MAPFYQRYKRNLKLHQDDIKAIQVFESNLENNCKNTKIFHFKRIGDLWYEKQAEIQSKWS